MLYKIIFVDDEKVIRESLTQIFDWQSLGFEVAGTFKDGKEVISYINENPVDVILSDIKMTFVSGLELSEYIYNNKLDIKVILMSAYKEFEFARQAIKFNVSHYILKPMDIKELKNLINGIKEQLDTKYAQIEQISNQRQKFEYVIPLMQRQLLIDITMGALQDKEEIRKCLEFLEINIDLEKSQCCTLWIHIVNFDEYIANDWKYSKDVLYRTLQKYLQVSVEGINYYVINNCEDKVQLIAAGNSENSIEDLKDSISRFLENVKKEIKSAIQLDITGEMEGGFDNLINLHSVKKPLTATEVGLNDDIHDIMKSNSIFLEKQKLIICYINAGNIEKVRSMFDTFLDDLKEYDMNLIHGVVIELFSLLNNKLKEFGANIFTIKENEFAYNDILKFENVKELKSWGLNILDIIAYYIQNNTEYSSRQLIQKAKEYINEHCCDDITLEDIAKQIYLNPVYFSRLFKEQTGENFSDYLIGLRMKRAMKLLNDEKIKVYEISLMIGYKSVQYFYRLFKQYTGFTPTEYRNHHLEVGDL